MRSNSNSSSTIPLVERARYYRDLFRMHMADGATADVKGLRDDFDRIDTLTKSIMGRDFAVLDAVEIGFGSKPYRIMYFNSRGVNAFGIDMDQPVLEGSPREFLSIARKNGSLRAIKSCIRYSLFERSARRKFLNQIRTKDDPGFAFDSKRLVVGNAGTADPWNQIAVEPDLIYSIYVFEHMEPHSIVWLLELLRQRIRKNALLYIVITVYTGLIGSHLTEWYPHRVSEKNKRSEPWEHLRRDRLQADTYLNKMTRRQYASMFSTYFEVLQDQPVWPDFGKEYLTEAVRRDLPQYDEYELLSNDVCFVLRPKDASV